MAVAAYLMKYHGMTVAEACNQIKDNRERSTIFNKIPSLVAYRKHLQTNPETQEVDPNFNETEELVDALVAKAGGPMKFDMNVAIKDLEKMYKKMLKKELDENTIKNIRETHENKYFHLRSFIEDLNKTKNEVNYYNFNTKEWEPVINALSANPEKEDIKDKMEIALDFLKEKEISEKDAYEVLIGNNSYYKNNKPSIETSIIQEIKKLKIEVKSPNKYEILINSYTILESKYWSTVIKVLFTKIEPKDFEGRRNDIRKLFSGEEYKSILHESIAKYLIKYQKMNAKEAFNKTGVEKAELEKYSKKIQFKTGIKKLIKKRLPIKNEDLKTRDWSNILNNLYNEYKEKGPKNENLNESQLISKFLDNISNIYNGDEKVDDPLLTDTILNLKIKKLSENQGSLEELFSKDIDDQQLTQVLKSYNKLYSENKGLPKILAQYNLDPDKNFSEES